MIICVTGKIGTGKSTISRFFEKKGFHYINMDVFGHEAFQENIEKIAQAFGETDRKKISEIVFSAPEKLKLLESIVHPTMMKMLDEELERLKGKDVIIEAAIKRRLGIDCCDLTITVLSDPEMIKKRLKKRYTPEKIDEILKQQTDVIEEGIVVRNDGTIEELYTKLKNLFEEKIVKSRQGSA